MSAVGASVRPTISLITDYTQCSGIIDIVVHRFCRARRACQPGLSTPRSLSALSPHIHKVTRHRSRRQFSAQQHSQVVRLSSSGTSCSWWGSESS